MAYCWNVESSDAYQRFMPYLARKVVFWEESLAPGKEERSRLSYNDPYQHACRPMLSASKAFMFWDVAGPSSLSEALATSAEGKHWATTYQMFDILVHVRCLM